MRRVHGNQSAFLLITILVMLVAMVAVGAASLTRSATELQGSTRFTTSHRAFHLAEASVDAAIVNFQGGQLDGLVLSTLSSGSYWATVHPQGGLVYLVNGHGLQGLEQRDVEAVVRLTPRSIFQYGLFGGDQVIISGQAITDSFDSSQGAYDPGTAGAEGDLGTNSVVTGGITISGSIAINGQVAVGPGVADPGSVVAISGGTALITGSPPVESQSTTMALPQVTVPEGLTCEDMVVTGQTTLLLPSVLVHHCFHDLTVSGGGMLTADGPVKVYVTGAFTASGNTVIGIPSDPTAMLLFLVSNEQATFEGSLTGSTEFYGGMYAPSATIAITSNAQVFGSVVARTVDVSGDAQVHYDHALGNLTEPIGIYDTDLLSWREP
ncbi:MAG: hypothetical protein Q8R78_01075 [Candidatus Omnitrophota bacterium]|nr:hypothetical protein [Candidatus Omnitrophota bacterium]